MFLIVLFLPFILVLSCLFGFLFRKWLGPIGFYYLSVFNLFLNISGFIFIFIYNSIFGFYFFIDLGLAFKVLDILELKLVFCLDNLSIISIILVLLLGILAQTFGIEYMYREAFILRLLYLLNMFISSVIFLFIVYDFFLILVCWELIGLFSFLLVNFYSIRVYTIKAALKTFIFSRISDLFIFLAFSIILLVINSSDLSVLFLKIPFFLFHFINILGFKVHFLTTVSLFLVISGGIKGAQFFSHVWLPDAMEAPTPASALIHSSTLVIMGVYLILRFNIIFEFATNVNYFLALWGGVTIAFGALSASFQTDMKKLVAYSTISQMGYLFSGCGFCCYDEVLVYLVIHAVNKAFLFVLVGYTVHFFNANTDFRQMGGLYIYNFDICVFFFITSLNLIGLPYSSGFFSKEFLLFQVLRDGFVSTITRCMWFVSFVFTPYYMFLLCFNVFIGYKKSSLTNYLLITNNQTSSLNFYQFLFKNNVVNNLYNQISLVNSRLSSLVLLLFWFMFIFSGEYLMNISLGLNNYTNFVNANFFNNIHYNFSTSIYNYNSSLDSNIFRYIIIFTFISLTNLAIFRLFSSRFIVNQLSKFNVVFILLIIFLVI